MTQDEQPYALHGTEIPECTQSLSITFDDDWDDDDDDD